MAVLLSARLSAGEPAADLYVTQVKPILAARCFSCHGALKQEAGLRLDASSQIRKGGDSGPAVVAGHSADSLLIARVTAEDDAERMPAEGAPLSAAQIQVLKNWVDSGAIAPEEPLPPGPADHWAFQPPRRAAALESVGGDVASNPIDALLSTKHGEKRLQPAPLASKSLLLRRVYLDLIGLPPSQQQLHAFLADTSPDAYDKVVDQLLASPHYGERWARHWMDVWRYSDGFGLGGEIRYSQPHMWRFRDWIIESLNADKGYDQMIREMLSADEIAPSDPKVLAANGFLARHWYLFNRNVWLDNVIDSTARGLLGLTMNCARCHDHKYDPIGQQDYYRFRAFFEPHMVRTERLPGQPDVKSDGVPRAYDAQPDTPTYLFIRGDEKRPEKEKAYSPALPAIFAKSVAIRPVELPLAAWYPGLRDFERTEGLAAAEESLRKAIADNHRASQTLSEARKRLDQSESGVAERLAQKQSPVLEDDFSRPRPDVWQCVGGQWQYDDGQLIQAQAAPPQTQLASQVDHPRDFLATLTLEVAAGGTRSVGLAFDRDEHGYVGVFLSPSASKVQIYYILDGQEVYPADAVKTLPLDNGLQYELKAAVRGQLLNVWVDGNLVLAHKLLHPRREGRFALTSYEAVVAFSHVAVAPLPPEVVLHDDVQAAGAPSGESKASAELRAAVARAEASSQATAAAENAARAELASFRARLAAEEARLEQPPNPAAVDLAIVAHDAEAKASLAGARVRLAAARKRLAEESAAVDSKGKESQDSLAKARTDFEQSEKQLRELRQKPNEVSQQYATLGPEYPRSSTGRRFALARWISDRDNPLTARVAVNHVWARHFGEPIVASMFDFGLRTPRPLHADILDALAVEFMESGWSMKALHKRIVTSQAYQRASSGGIGDPSAKTDPDNHYLWRMNQRRMEGEIVRDSLLAMSGKLDPTLGGKESPVESAAAGTRRTIYYRYAREPVDKVPVLMTFDAPNVEECYRRQETVVPQQALMLINSKMALQGAMDVASNIERELASGGADVGDHQFVVAAFERVLGRAPSSEELAACQQALSRFADASVVGASVQGTPSQRARQGLVHVLLNHNDFVAIR